MCSRPVYKEELEHSRLGFACFLSLEKEIFVSSMKTKCR